MVLPTNLVNLVSRYFEALRESTGVEMGYSFCATSYTIS